MSIKKELFCTISLSLLAVGLQLPGQAQTIASADSVTETGIANEPALVEEVVTPTNETAADLTFSEPTLQLSDLTFNESQGQDWAQAESLSANPTVVTEAFVADELITEALPAQELVAVESSSVGPIQPVTEASELAYPAIEEPEELAQIRRRRTRGGAASGANFIGIGADFGFADDISFAAISKFSFTEQWAVRPTILLGDDFSVLVPVTYDFSRFGTAVSGFQLRPYAGVGGSFTDSEDSDSDINLLLSAGVDVPVSERFTLNAQVNWGVLNDSQFGGTVGIGYNLDNIFQ